jgi:hypothetical protein
MNECVPIPLKSAGSSGVILPPVYFMLVAAWESIQLAGMAQSGFLNSKVA